MVVLYSESVVKLYSNSRSVINPFLYSKREICSGNGRHENMLCFERIFALS